MFEDSTFESTGRIRTRSRGWMVATFTLNSTVLAALALFPILYPEALPRMKYIFLMSVPPPQQEAPQPLARETPPREMHQSEMRGTHVLAPSVIPQRPYEPNAPELPGIHSLATMDMGPQGRGNELNAFRKSSTAPSVRAERQTKARVSQGVMEGFLAGKVLPEYPPIARAAGIEGTVVLQATISKTGTIENVRVVSGPIMLQRAAVDAVRQWRYRPYLLNGEPVEVETTVNVQFTLH